MNSLSKTVWLMNIPPGMLGVVFNLCGGYAGAPMMFARAEGITAETSSVGIYCDAPSSFRFEPVDPADPEHVRVASRHNQRLVENGRVPGL